MNGAGTKFPFSGPAAGQNVPDQPRKPLPAWQFLGLANGVLIIITET